MEKQIHYGGFLGTAMVCALALLVAGIARAQVASSSATSTAANGPPPTCTLTIDPTIMKDAGQLATLSWTSNGATSAIIDQNVGMLADPTSGSITVIPAYPVTYTGSFSGPAGSTTCSAFIQVGPNPASSTANVIPSPMISPVPGATSTNAVVPMNSVVPLSAVAPTTTLITTATSSPQSLNSGASQAAAAPAADFAPPSYPALGSTPAPMIVQADASGHVLLRGTVRSRTDTSVSIDTWGGMWVVRVSPSASVFSGNGGVLSSIAVGDFVGVDGTVAQDQAYTIDASVVRDWTTAPLTTAAPSSGNNSGNSSTAPEAGGGATLPSAASSSAGASTPSSFGTLYTGTASNVSDASFTLTDSNGVVFDVKTDTSTVFIDQADNSIALGDIQNGDSIRLDGSVGSDGSTISATVVRDTSGDGSAASSTSGTESAAPIESGTSSSGASSY